MTVQLRDIDLNLLLVFHQLKLDASVSKAAESLGLSQPAVSNALARLRKILGDELFLRTSRGMESTPFALQLAEPVAEALATLHSALNQRVSFAAASSSRDFRIAMTDIGEIHFLPKLLSAITKSAPQVRLSTVLNTSVNVRDEMEAGTVDLAIGLIPNLKGGFFQRRLFKQRYVCVMSRTHPLGRKKTLSMKDFAAAEHAVIVAAGTGHGQIDGIIERAGVARNVRLTVPHFAAIGHILAGSELIATVPQALADRICEPFHLVEFAHPVPLPEITINVFWHAKFHRDPANKWLRETISLEFAR
jgi:DNA-binding transcriptional LysR family regulator